MTGFRTTLIAASALLAAGSVAAQETPADAPPQTAAERRLAELETEQKIAEAEQAIRQANSDLIPPSGIDGTVEIKTGGGGPEVLAIAAHQLQLGARRIISETVDPGAAGLWISTGTSRPDITAWQFFTVRQEALEKLLQAKAAQLAAAAASEGKSADGAAGLGVGAAISAASALLSYLRSDFSVAGVDVSGLDDDALASAVMAAAPGRIQRLDTAAIRIETLQDVHDRLLGLDVLRDRLEPARLECIEIRKAADAAVEAARTDAARVRARAQFADRIEACDEIRTLITQYDAFVALYASADPTLMATVIRQADVDRRLGERDLLLVKLHKVQGAGYTQTNLVSHLGGMPYHVTTSSVISWQRMDRTGVVVDSGWAPLYFGYRRLGEVGSLIATCENCSPAPFQSAAAAGGN